MHSKYLKYIIRKYQYSKISISRERSKSSRELRVKVIRF
jgi:hypothetical protein